MATECRKRAIKHRQIKLCVRLIICLLIGIAVGRLTVPAKIETKTITQTEIVEVPATSNELPVATDVFYFDIPLSHSLQKYIYEICADENVPVTLTMAIIEHESQFDSDVVSSTDDYGLMQINKINHERLEEQYRCADMTDPYQNVFCGIKIIGSYIEKYEGDISKALMAYNMGDYGAEKAWENGITNTNYSNAVIELMRTYERELSDGKND